MKKIKLILYIFGFTLIFLNNLNADNSKQVDKISKNLRCLICQGQSVYDSQSDFALSMKILIDRKINEGKNEKEIYAFLKNISKIDIIGINYKDKKSNAIEFLSDLGDPYHEVLVDLDGTKSIELGAMGVPETYLINNEVVIKKYIGPLDEMKFKEIIEIIKNEKN